MLDVSPKIVKANINIVNIINVNKYTYVLCFDIIYEIINVC